MIPWTHGWITGFLTENKPDWSKARDETIRQSERGIVVAAVLSLINKMLLMQEIESLRGKVE